MSTHYTSIHTTTIHDHARLSPNPNRPSRTPHKSRSPVRQINYKSRSPVRQSNYKSRSPVRQSNYEYTITSLSKRLLSNQTHLFIYIS